MSYNIIEEIGGVAMVNILVDQLTEAERADHEKWMLEAIREANKARAMGEVPIGAVIVNKGQVIGRGHNVRESQKQATGHAEIQAIQEANKNLQAWRLEGTSLYVTLEPCPMCAGALVLARINQVVFAARDPKGGCGGSLMNLLQEERFNHQIQVIEGICAEECSQMMTDFFRALRQSKKT